MNTIQSAPEFDGNINTTQILCIKEEEEKKENNCIVLSIKQEFVPRISQKVYEHGLSQLEGEKEICQENYKEILDSSIHY